MIRIRCGINRIHLRKRNKRTHWIHWYIDHFTKTLQRFGPDRRLPRVCAFEKNPSIPKTNESDWELVLIPWEYAHSKRIIVIESRTSEIKILTWTNRLYQHGPEAQHGRLCASHWKKNAREFEGKRPWNGINYDWNKYANARLDIVAYFLHCSYKLWWAITCDASIVPLFICILQSFVLYAPRKNLQTKSQLVALTQSHMRRMSVFVPPIRI